MVPMPILHFTKMKMTEIAFHWDNTAKRLTIKAREGNFPGMLKKRSFRIVLVNGKNGVGMNAAARVKQVKYNGNELSVQM